MYFVLCTKYNNIGVFSRSVNAGLPRYLRSICQGLPAEYYTPSGIARSPVVSSDAPVDVFKFLLPLSQTGFHLPSKPVGRVSSHSSQSCRCNCRNDWIHSSFRSFPSPVKTVVPRAQGCRNGRARFFHDSTCHMVLTK